MEITDYTVGCKSDACGRLLRSREGGLTPPATLTDVTLPTHSHENSAFGGTVQQKALAVLSASNVKEATGCCGVAGNFCIEAKPLRHLDVKSPSSTSSVAPCRSNLNGRAYTLQKSSTSRPNQLDSLGWPSLAQIWQYPLSSGPVLSSRLGGIRNTNSSRLRVSGLHHNYTFWILFQQCWS